MANDRVIGGAIFGGSIIGVIVYGVLIFLLGSTVSLLVLEVSAFLAVLLLLGILAWIGYTMATTPPPEPITEIPDVSQKAQDAPKTEVKDTKS